MSKDETGHADLDAFCLDITDTNQSTYIIGVNKKIVIIFHYIFMKKSINLLIMNFYSLDISYKYYDYINTQ